MLKKYCSLYKTHDWWRSIYKFKLLEDWPVQTLQADAGQLIIFEKSSLCGRILFSN